MYPDVFECVTFSFRTKKKVSTSTRIRIQIEFARPQVSGGFVCLIHRYVRTEAVSGEKKLRIQR